MSSTQPIILSICVPTYNRQFLLERNVTFHLDSFRKLGIPFEIVIVDDCSTDNTPAYIASISDNPEINAFRRVKNSGFVSNYSFAMQRARGRYAVFLGDDDLLIPEKVVEYVRLMEQDPALGVIQAPWMLVDVRNNANTDIGPFYRLPGPIRHSKGNFLSMLDMILNYHVFPEFMIIRRSVLAKAISSPTPFIFWAFLYTTRALEGGDIMFVPEPFARVTAVSDDPRQQQGNKECMFLWDTYRGGIEYLVSRAAQVNPFSPDEKVSLNARILKFMMMRQAVALRLHVEAGNWPEAYIMYHRMAAHEQMPLSPDAFGQICKLAGVVTAAREATEFSNEPIILDPMIETTTLNLLPQDIRARMTYPVEGAAKSQEPRAYLRFNPAFPENPGPKDGIFDIREYIAQFG